MKTVDENDLLDMMPVAPNTPKDIVWLVKMLKLMAKFNDADLKKDRKTLIDYFVLRRNEYSPQALILNLKMSRKDVARLYDKAVRWIGEVENGR